MMVIKPPNQVFVKLVSGQYGEVHRLLAAQIFAPELHGYSDHEGTPKAFVMEFLDPPRLG